MSEINKKIIIIDNGTGFSKCGYAGEKLPSHVFHAMVGRPMMRSEEVIDNIKIKDIMCGEECAKLRSMLEISYPVTNGIITNWEDMFHLWNHTFNEVMKINPRECKIMLTEAALNPLQNRKKMLEAMLEKYQFQGVHVATQAVLTLYAQGLTTGVVLDSGDGVTHIVPVYESYGLPNQIKRLNVAGRDVTKYLIELLRLRGYNFNRTADFETVAQIKERFCYVGTDLRLEDRLANETTVLAEPFELPDGRIVRVSRERYMAPECLFQPHVIGLEDKGIARQVFNCVNESDIDLRRSLYAHIILSGGTTMFPGFPTRVQTEVRQIYKEVVLGDSHAKKGNIKINVEDPPRRYYFVFSGGSVLAAVGEKANPESFWLSQKEYKEKGVDYLLKRSQQ